MPTMFLGYANKPEAIRESIATASVLLNRTRLVDSFTWEELRVGGRLVSRQVLDAIRERDVCAVEISTLNQNVLFELGYAIALGKSVWILLDSTDDDAIKRWNEFQILKSVGFTPWANSEDIRDAFISERPDENEKNLYDDLFEPEFKDMIQGSLFFLPIYHNTDAAKAIARKLDHEEKKGVHILTADPTESSINPLQWYAAKAYGTECTIVHFDSPRRKSSEVHNQRAALIAGIAWGLERPLLMLAEEGYESQVDYGDLLQIYNSSKEAELILDRWLSMQNLVPRAGARTPRIKLAAELRALRFGEHVAENERDALSEYFVETASFNSVLADRNSLFIGRKGTGKTASMFQAAARLSEDVRNLVVVIKPASYEFSSLLSLLSSLPVSLQQYSIEAIWKFLLVSEIAGKAVEAMESRPVGIPYTEPEKKLLEFIESSDFGLDRDFGARFETTVTALLALNLESTGESKGRDLLNEALHSQAISRIRSLLGPVLKGRKRVAVLIDNLDKGWERSADLDMLSNLLLGLLSAIGRVDLDFKKEDYWRDRISLTVSTFLRSDIYEHMRGVAREPDKIPAAMVAWEDPTVLIRIIEERFLATRSEGTLPEELWSRYFCETVSGLPTKQYILDRCLPRPRDIIYWCNASVICAADRGNQKVEEADILSSEHEYSQFAFEALLVENGITIAEFKAVLFEFLGEPSVLEEASIRSLILHASIPETKVDHVLKRLCNVSFLGIETSRDSFQYPLGDTEYEKMVVLARKHALKEGREGIRYRIHSAYRAYLEVEEMPNGVSSAGGSI